MTALPPPVSALVRRLGLAPGTLTDTDLARAEEALADAAALALAEIPALTAARWATDAPAAVVAIVCKAARREFDNPEGVTQESLGGRMVGLSNVSGAYLTARELATIRRAARRHRGGPFVGTLRTPSAYTDAS